MKKESEREKKDKLSCVVYPMLWGCEYTDCIPLQMNVLRGGFFV